MVRVLNTSKGADEEVVFAKDNGIPVFFSIKELISANMSR